MVKRGSRIAKKYGYIFLKYYPTVMLLMNEFDNLEEKKIYVFDYNYRFKTFNAVVQKLTPNTLKIHLLYHYIYMTKENNGFTISIPEIYEKWRKEISDFFIYILDVHYNKIIYKNNDKIRIRQKAPFQIKIEVAKKTYCLDPTTEKVRVCYLPEKVAKYGMEIGIDNKDNRFMITKINNKDIMKIRKRIEKKKNEPDIYYRKAMKTRTAMYLFIKTFRNKGILQMPIQVQPISIYSGLRINNETIRDYAFRFSFPYELRNNSVRFNGVETVLVDYDYDQVNQILFKLQLKIMTGIERTVLCGIDQNNRLWCNVLRGFMKWWKIEDVYKNMFELDEKTKIYEF
jgi:hypothetical protein